MVTTEKINMSELRDEVVKIVNDYLGPASERFVDRNIRTHLGKEPEDLSKEDILKMCNWMKISLSIISSNAQIAQEAVDRIIKVTNAGSVELEK